MSNILLESKLVCLVAASSFGSGRRLNIFLRWHNKDAFGYSAAVVSFFLGSCPSSLTSVFTRGTSNKIACLGAASNVLQGCCNPSALHIADV